MSFYQPTTPTPHALKHQYQQPQAVALAVAQKPAMDWTMPAILLTAVGLLGMWLLQG